MSALDQLNDIELGLIADAVRKLCPVLVWPDDPPILPLTGPERAALARLMDLCPAGPVAVNGEEREPA